MRLVCARDPPFRGRTEASLHRPGPPFVQIAAEGGFLPEPVLLEGSRKGTLLLAPAERADLIVDFSDVPAGSILILYNDAPAPFPAGDPSVDFDPNSREIAPPPTPGFGQNPWTPLQ